MMYQKDVHRLGADGPVSDRMVREQSVTCCITGRQIVGTRFAMNVLCDMHRARVMTERNRCSQKPLYKTRYMLDELGNLQSEGHGIDGFQTMLSIGLGQDQQFTLILQTLQQLRDVYGDSVDKIIQGNAQPLEARIATPKGWTTMGEIAVGDEVLTPRGKVARVIGVYPRGKRPVYRVRRRSGASTLACNQHLWVARVK